MFSLAGPSIIGTSTSCLLVQLQVGWFYPGTVKVYFFSPASKWYEKIWPNSTMGTIHQSIKVYKSFWKFPSKVLGPIGATIFLHNK